MSQVYLPCELWIHSGGSFGFWVCLICKGIWKAQLQLIENHERCFYNRLCFWSDCLYLHWSRSLSTCWLNTPSLSESHQAKEWGRSQKTKRKEKKWGGGGLKLPFFYILASLNPWQLSNSTIRQILRLEEVQRQRKPFLRDRPFVGENQWAQEGLINPICPLIWFGNWSLLFARACMLITRCRFRRHKCAGIAGIMSFCPQCLPVCLSVCLPLSLLNKTLNNFKGQVLFSQLCTHYTQPY